MHQCITSVIIQDEATAKLIVEQTELTTLAVSAEVLPVLADLKKSDSDGKMKSLTTVICFESSFSEEAKQAADDAGLALYTMDYVIDRGREAEG